jgi:multidrug efflux pump subunit AcrB
MKGIITLFVRRPLTVIMILAALIFAAVFSLFTLPVNRLPSFSTPRVTVETLYQGMAANEVRSMVTIPLEDGLSPIKGLERIRSVSRDNRALISLDFRWGTDTMSASVLVREAIDAVYPGLPEGVNKPTVTAADMGNEAHAVIAVSSHNGNGEFARKLAEYEMQARLRRIDGVGSVVLIGGEIKEERLSIDVRRLSALGIAPSEFANLVAQETADVPAGNAREGNMELVVVSSGKPDSVSSLSQIILPAANGGSFRIEDTAEITNSTARRESIFIHNGKEAAGLEIYRRPGSDPLRLSREIKKTLDEANSLFSRDAKIELVTDSSSSLISGIIGLLISAALGVTAVVTVLLLFIRRIKYSLLAALSIPTSAAAGICVLSVMGKSLNGMSLSGLAMGIGLVSDISVIIIDLLHQAFGERETAPVPEEIGNKAASISGSNIASTITTALVFIPIIMLPGPLGGLFGDIAIALVTSVAAGWLYAQFFLPSLYSMFFGNPLTANKNRLIKFNSVFTNGSLEKKYYFLLSSILRNSGKFFAAAVVLSVLGFLTLLTRPAVFINPDESEEIQVSIIYPQGTLLDSMTNNNVLSKIDSRLPFVKTVYGIAGAEEADVIRRADIDYKKEELILHCILEKGYKPQKALDEINKILKNSNEYSCTAYFPKDRIEILLGLSAERTFVIKGKDREELLGRINLTQNEFDSASTAVNFRPKGKRPEIRVYPNREAAAYLSLPASQIAETLFVLNEGVVTTKLEIDGKPLNVRVTGERITRNDPVQRLEQIPLKTGQGKTVYLGSVVKIEQKEAEASLARLDRADVIYADISAGKEIPSIVKKLAARFSWFTGADESVFSRYKNSLLFYVILVLVLLYMTMGAQFESFLLPLVLMLSIPFSLAGAGPALIISGSKIDSGAVLGLTALFGLVVNNSLILFEISEQKIQAGFPVTDAVCRGASERLQAILITTTTTVFALLPLIFSPLGNSQKSMAAAMLGGLTVSTLISLFAIPSVLIRYFKWKIRNEEDL